MLSRTSQTSHIKEYYCQYTDQLLKKHKTWHDGRLKFFELNKKFQLFTVDDNVLLGSGFVTNVRRLERILSESFFGKEEHKIFSQFLVIIDCLEREYDRDIGTLAREGLTPYNIKVHPGTALAPSPSNQNTKLRRESPQPSSHQDTLALRFNTPFRRPRMAPREITAASINTPPTKKQLKQPLLRKSVTRTTAEPVEKQSVSLALDASKMGCGQLQQRTSRRRKKTVVIAPGPQAGFEDSGNLSSPGPSLSTELALSKAHPQPIAQHWNISTFRINKKKTTIYHEPIKL
ncbi:Mte1p [Lachancea thermotolerans CBS 6340]|uniref:KLTH0G17402p n=1 Tax=Lachancea thermotolerans (strain ATCC 56472 / CBS 6340 / NRRL Y-8284) TaxID=559295 RepID=C5DNI8_LACTC|nr:KLTH0G17402p [Lachancea thermotolerans CBS 6340]CAR25349.1 KLTH0G17402p [Lachancea thermotolerans CBS 6340]